MLTRTSLTTWLRYLKPVLVAALLVVGVRSSLADHYVVPTGSMEPTVVPGDRILVNKAAYRLRVPLVGTTIAEVGAPERGDVVVLESPEDGTVLLKRVVALPGDRVEVHHGQVWIDGVEQRGDYTIRTTFGGGPDLRATTVPEGRYLVLGDNRGRSHDGRVFGFVDGDAILGEAVGVFMSDGGFVWREL